MSTVNEMERLVLSNDQLAQKRGADYGEDYFKSGQKASVSFGKVTTVRDVLSCSFSPFFWYPLNFLHRESLVLALMATS